MSGKQLPYEKHFSRICEGPEEKQDKILSSKSLLTT